MNSNITDCYAESDAEEPGPQAKRGRGARRAKAELPEATDKGKGKGCRNGKAAGKDAAAADKADGANAAASRPSYKSKAGENGVLPRFLNDSMTNLIHKPCCLLPKTHGHCT